MNSRMVFFCSCSLRLLPYYISKWEHPRVYMLGHAAGACWNTALKNSLQKDATQALAGAARNTGALTKIHFVVEHCYAFHLHLLTFGAAAQP